METKKTLPDGSTAKISERTVRRSPIRLVADVLARRERNAPGKAPVVTACPCQFGSERAVRYFGRLKPLLSAGAFHFHALRLLRASVSSKSLQERITRTEKAGVLSS